MYSPRPCSRPNDRRVPDQKLIGEHMFEAVSPLGIDCDGLAECARQTIASS